MTLFYHEEHGDKEKCFALFAVNCVDYIGGGVLVFQTSKEFLE